MRISRLSRLDTGLIDRNIDSLTAVEAALDHIIALAVLAASGMVRNGAEGSDPVAAIGPFEIWGSPRRQVALTSGDAEQGFEIERVGAQDWRIGGDGLEAGGVELTMVRADGCDWQFSTAGVTRRCRVVCAQDAVTVFHEGLTHGFLRPSGARGAEQLGGGDQVVSAMPGIIKQVLVEPGQAVASGDPMVIMEAMKMEMTLNAPRDGVVSEVLVSEGAQVTDGAILVALEAQAKAA